MIFVKNDRGPQKNNSGLFTNRHDFRGMQIAILEYQHISSSTHYALEQFCYAQLRGSLAEALHSLWYVLSISIQLMRQHLDKYDFHRLSSSNIQKVWLFCMAVYGPIYVHKRKTLSI